MITRASVRQSLALGIDHIALLINDHFPGQRITVLIHSDNTNLGPVSPRRQLTFDLTRVRINGQSFRQRTAIRLSCLVTKLTDYLVRTVSERR